MDLSTNKIVDIQLVQVNRLQKLENALSKAGPPQSGQIWYLPGKLYFNNVIKFTVSKSILKEMLCLTEMPQSNEVRSSVHMEKEGLIRSLEFLDRSGVKVASVVTDRHTQVQKLLREQKPHINHFYDVWHLCKGMII